MRNWLILCVAVTLFGVPTNNSAHAADAIVAPSPDVASLLDGVKEIAAPGLPGVVAFFGNAAFAVVAGNSGKNVQAPVMVAAQAGKGRIIAFGHDGYLSPENLEKADTTKLMLNALRWAGGPKVGVVGREATLKWLQQNGVNAQAARIGALENVDVLIANAHDLRDADVAPLRAFLERGGGLITAATGWGWAMLNEEQDITRDFAGNKLLTPYGIVWTTATLDRTGKDGFLAMPISALTNGTRALEAITAHLNNSKTLSSADAAQASATLSALAQSLPQSDEVVMPRLRALVSGASGDVVPLARRPIKIEDANARLLLTLQTVIGKTLSPDQIKPHPAGAIFPGDVPPNAKSVTQNLNINTHIPDWHSTGLYAAPGAKIKITLPAGSEKAGLGVRIGCHTDHLWNLDSWQRAPEISRAWPLKTSETTVANPFGGLIYITVPRNSKAATVSITIAGAHEAPRYVLGQTDDADWKNRLRWLPGPWAEIETNRVIVTVPSRAIRDLENPREVAELYVKALDAIADLATIPQQRTRPERIVADQQISAGYMHSGYPVMTWLDVEKASVDAEALRKNSWGHWHEFGHNHQIGDWTFGGTGEVTCNLFALYVWEKVIGKERNLAHPALRPESVKKEWDKYVAGGRKFSDLQGNPFLFLQMYVQLQDAFGWDVFKKVFTEYRGLKESERPKTDDAKRDQWLVRFSRAAGKNLGPFFEKWGVPTSVAARDSIKDLSSWMPTGF